MNDLLIQLAKSNTPVFILVISIFFLFMFFREYNKVRINLKKIKVEADDIISRKQNLSRDSNEIVNFNFELLEKYYEQTLGEYKLNSRATIIIACLGFVVVLIGVGFVLSGTISVGIISSICGVIAEGATVLFFKQNEVHITQVKEYHKKLISTQYLLTAISLANELDEDTCSKEKMRIITNLLYLSNELHGSQSNHLFKAN